MGDLVAAVEAEIDTDFALLNVYQRKVGPDPGARFALSAPGAVGMGTGFKYSRVALRVERWDGPPPSTEGWEDIDEMPFEEVPGAGELVLGGFDPSDTSLDVAGFGRGRVQVFARGRHRYTYGSIVDASTLPREDWLVRLYPHEGPHDPMSGGPRRLAGHGGSGYQPQTFWHAAVHGLRTSGWSQPLNGSHGFHLAELALARAEGPLSRLELSQQMLRGMPPWQAGGDDAESVPIPPRSSRQEGPDHLALCAGMTDVTTAADVIDALLILGLLLREERGDVELLIPNPSPEPYWDRRGLTGEQRRSSQLWATRAEHADIAANMSAAAGWRGESGLRATPRQMAVRWATTVPDVLGGLRILDAEHRIVADRQIGFEVEPPGADDEITLMKPRRGGRT